MSNIVKTGDLTQDFGRYGIDSLEDQEAIQEAIADGFSFEEAAESLGYSEVAIAESGRGGKAVELRAATVNVPSAKVVTSDPEVQFGMGKTVGRSIVYENANAFNAGLQEGFAEGIGHAASATEQLVREADGGAEEFFRALAAHYLQ